MAATNANPRGAVTSAPGVRLAPGHARNMQQPDVRTGIEWLPGEVRLWELDQDSGEPRITLRAAHDTTSAWQFFYELRYVELFPEVTHWWYRSLWTQRVRTEILATPDPATILGQFHFVEEGNTGAWSVALDTRPAVVSVSLPPSETFDNVPLACELSRLAVAAVHDEIPQQQWMIASSLVRREDAAAVLATGPDVEDRVTQRRWRLEAIGERPLREFLLRTQGLRPGTPEYGG